MFVEEKDSVNFPLYEGTIVNMMPIIMGDDASLPKEVSRYAPLIEKTHFVPGDTVYLTVHESIVEVGRTQRRAGVHTDGTSHSSWGAWGKSKGIYLASTDGDCLVWNMRVQTSDRLGSITRPNSIPIRLEGNRLYCIGDRTPHESLPSSFRHARQFFRLVGPDIGAWWKQHSTPNPLGVKPKAPVLLHNKFI